jgi:predicted 2-oxoglutarate/Fe(II)-dependent dioxygenase YbiX
MRLSDSVLIQRNAIVRDDLAFVIRYAQKASKIDSLVSDFENEPDAASDAVEWVVNKKVRDTQEVHLSDKLRNKLTAFDDKNILAFINPFYGVEVRDRERSQILHYGVGGHYIPHVDAETLYKDDLGHDVWEKTLDRDLSIVYFLNDDFAGGELVFPDLDLLIKPEAGTLVCFPSDHNFVHGVRPVTSGHRYTIVTWMRVKGMPTPEEINEMTKDEYNRVRPRQMRQPPRIVKGGRYDSRTGSVTRRRRDAEKNRNI